MIQTCTPDYRAGAGRPDLPTCGETFDDVDHSTLCPHKPILARGDRATDVLLAQIARDVDDRVAIMDRIERLEDVADRFDHPGGSRALARRARDKADGLRTALRILEATR